MTAPPTAEPSPVSIRAEEKVLFEGHPALLPSLGYAAAAVLTLGLAVAYFWLKQRAKHYRVTSERIVVKSGLLSKRIDQLDIYRINDFVVELPFSQRLMNTGNLVLRTLESENPEIRLEGLKTDVQDLYERLRRATEEEKRRRGVRVVDYE
ncbi:MAG: PH domain-containing protein [Myxococcota bacterium]